MAAVTDMLTSGEKTLPHRGETERVMVTIYDDHLHKYKQPSHVQAFSVCSPFTDFPEETEIGEIRNYYVSDKSPFFHMTLDIL